MRLRARGLLIAVVLGAAATVPASALAGEAHVGWRYYTGTYEGAEFLAAPGEENHLTVTETASNLILKDTGAEIDAGTGCDPVDANTVSCPNGYRLEVALKDGDDELTLNLRPGGPFDVPEEGLHFPPVIWGGDGGDTLRGSAFGESIDGGDGDDTILAGDGPDSVSAGLGEDRVYMGAGHDRAQTVDVNGEWEEGGYPEDDDPPNEADLFVGGPGHDELQYIRRVDDLRLTAGDGLANDGAPDEHDEIAGDVETLWGGDGDDDITLSPLGGDAYGGRGADTLLGGIGNDNLEGNEGNDRLTGGPGADGLNGGVGDDVLVGGPGGDSLLDDEPGGDDVLDALDGSTYLPIGPPDDRVLCGGGHNTLILDYSEWYSLYPRNCGGPIHYAADPALALQPDDSAVAREDEVKVEIECPQSATAACGGVLRMTVPAAELTAAAKRKPAVLAKGKVAVRRGRHRRVVLDLTKKGRRYFAEHDKVTARAAVRAQYEQFKTLKGVKVRIKRRG